MQATVSSGQLLQQPCCQCRHIPHSITRAPPRPYLNSCRHNTQQRAGHLQPSAYKLTPSGGQAQMVDQARFVVGSGADADLKLKGENVGPQHAELLQKNKQVFLRALQGESVFDRTHTWIDGDEARARVSYVLASGAVVAFGDQQQSFTVDFEEPSGSNPLVEMMMQGMAASADPEVKKALD